MRFGVANCCPFFISFPIFLLLLFFISQRWQFKQVLPTLTVLIPLCSFPYHCAAKRIQTLTWNQREAKHVKTSLIFKFPVPKETRLKNLCLGETDCTFYHLENFEIEVKIIVSTSSCSL